GVCMCTPEGESEWCNMVFAGLPEAARERALAAARQVAEGPAGKAEREWTGEIEIEVEGQPRWYELRIPARPAGAPTLVVVVREITGARQMERKVDAIDQAGRELSR